MVKSKMIKAKTLIYAALAAALLLSGCSGRSEREALRAQAIEYYQAGDYAGALDSFNKALDASRGEVSDFSFDLLMYRAECELRTGDFDAARSSYEALLLLDKDSSHDKSYEEIVSELDKLDSLSEAGDAFSQGSYSEAAAAYRQIASLDGSCAGQIAWFNEAVAYEYLGDFEEASYLFSRYLEVYPSDEAALKESLFCESRR